MAAISSSSTLSTSPAISRLQADYEDVMAPLKAFNEESPVRQVDVADKESEKTDQQAYMKRLESFKKFRSSWLNLPAKISPIALASHGWSVYKEDTVKCQECNEFLSVKINSADSDAQIYAIKYISSKLRSGHDRRCFWNSKILVQLPEEEFNLREAYMSVKLALRRHQNEDFQVSKTIGDEPILDENMENYLSPLLDKNEEACLLAFHGWKPDSTADSDGLKCRFCAVKIALDPYIMKMPFNPVKFHERYCIVRMNTVAYQQNVMVRNMDDLKASERNIVESLRGIQDYIDYFKSPEDSEQQEEHQHEEAENTNADENPVPSNQPQQQQENGSINAAESGSK